MIKDFDRGIKDEGAGNPEEVNKQLNDEKQSMVNTQNPFFCLARVENLVSSSSKFGRSS
ncbi:putative plant SNARE 13-like [Trifolium medium]|uniref:Putative plant SNARE 13-like n=1 Tax=Trifolium medium TaxID=97028 RepID=A0A392PMC9_9FABA|nr:putative plant SNARE 13-like [Trifolium medium]